MKISLLLILLFNLLCSLSYAEDAVTPPIFLNPKSFSIFQPSTSVGVDPFGISANATNFNIGDMRLDTTTTGFDLTSGIPTSVRKPQISSVIAESAYVTAMGASFSRTSVEETETYVHDVGNLLSNVRCRGGSGEVGKCSDFSGTAIEGSSFADLARLYVLQAPTLGGTFLPNFLKTTCDECFPEKYSMLASGKPKDDQKILEFNKAAVEEYQKYIELKSREKALQAFSEYSKFFERRQAYVSYLGSLDPESSAANACNSGENFKVQLEAVKKKYGCVDDQVLKKRMNDIETALHSTNVRAQSSDTFFDNLQKKMIDAQGFLPPLCNMSPISARVAFNRMGAASFTSDNTSVFGKMLSKEPYKTQVANCAETNEKCLQDVLLSYLKVEGRLSQDKAFQQLQTVYVANPFLRLFLKSKQGWISASRLQMNNTSSDENIDKNKTALLELYHNDSAQECTSYQNDLALSLCVKGDNAYKIISPVTMRRDLDSQIAKMSGQQGDDLIERNKAILKLMGAACQSTQINRGVDINNSVSLFALDSAADANNYSDIIFREGIQLPAKGNKASDIYGAYAAKACNDTMIASFSDGGGSGSGGAGGGGSSDGFLSGRRLAFRPEPIVPSCLICDWETRPLVTIDTNRLIADLKIPTIQIDPTAKASIDQLATTSKDGGTQPGDPTNTVSGQTRTQTAEVKPVTTETKEQVQATGQGVTGTTSTQLSTGAQIASTVGAMYSGTSTWRGPAGQIATGDGEEVVPTSPIGKKTSSTYTNLQQNEDFQTNNEAQLLNQTAQIQSLQVQKQMEEMRLEMEQLRQSNKTLLASIKKTSKDREQKGETNTFDSDPISDDVSEATPEVVSEVQPRGRVVATTTKVDVTATSGVVAGALGSGEAAVTAGTSSGVGARAQDNAVVSDGVGGARGVVVTNFNAGAAATSGYGQRVVTGGGSVGSVSSFAPSLVLQQRIGTTSEGVPALPQDQKIELLREFLSFVERNPDYKSGSYLSTANDQVTIDYGGRLIVVKVQDIADQGLRLQLQERLMRQRVILNQQTRDKRLENLRRLLAQARGTTEP